MSIGYEVNVTPLQLITLYNAIANGGRMMKPQFVTEVRHGNQTIEKFDPIVLNEHIASPEAIAMLQTMLEGVVERGTAKRQLADCGFKTAGKTGTAQYCDPRLGYKYSEPGVGHKLYNTTFVGYFPADKPKYSCIVVVNRARGRFWAAGSVSAPGFREIAEKVYAMRLGMQENDTVADTLSAPEPIPVIDVNHFNFQSATVPNVVGMDITDAVYLLENMGVKTNFSGEGTVKEQSLNPGDSIRANSVMNLKLGRL